ncbi:MAG TPA: hypothetical protein VK356_10610 [Thermomicrobiales bacterium]|nr:hypothetical protein [Thermomicrobiales bacterium]
MNRLLAIALAAAPLLAVATPAAAAPPQRIVESECFDGGGDSVICYNVKRMVKTTTTPSGNRIVHASVNNSVTLTTSDGEVRILDSFVYRDKYVIKHRNPNAFHVHRLQRVFTYTVWNHDIEFTCTETDYLKLTNGKYQVAEFEVNCT